jgi:hypothetical protein
LPRWATKPMQARAWSLRDRMENIKLTIVRLLHGIAEGRPIGNSLFQVLFFPKNSEFRNRTHSLSMGKGKNRDPLFEAPDHPLGHLSAFRPRLAGGWLGLGHAFLFMLGVRQKGRVVREVLKIGMYQQPCGLNQLVTWFGQHCHSLKTRNLGGFIPGTPAI